MIKKGLDQVTAWVLAVVLTGVVFGAGYAVTRVGSGHKDGDVVGEQDDGEHGGGGHDAPAEHAGAEHGGGHEAAAAHGEEHAAPAEHGGGHEPAAAHEAAPAHGEEHAAPAHGESHEPAGHDGGQHAAVAGPEQKLAAHDAPHWTYDGSTGPSHWAELSKEFKACDTGKRQSPVDIDETPTNQKLLPIRFHYKAADATVKNNGHTIQADMTAGNYVEIDGERYDLAQFHFHAPSEHKVAGAPYDLEVHFVHKNAEGKLAVIGVFFEEGAESKPLAKVWEVMPDEPGSAHEPIDVNPESFFPSRRLYWHYTGSLTTPPCSEGVKWFVMTQAITASQKQVDQFTRLFKYNARPVQPLAGRKVVKSSR